MFAATRQLEHGDVGQAAAGRLEMLFFFFCGGHESSKPLERRRWQRACVDMCVACVYVRARRSRPPCSLSPPPLLIEWISGVKFHQIPKQECESRRVEEEVVQEGVSSRSASQHLATHRALSPLLFWGEDGGQQL